MKNEEMKKVVVRWDKVKSTESETSNQISWWVNWMHGSCLKQT